MRSRATQTLPVLLAGAAALYLLSGAFQLDRLVIPTLTPIAPEQGAEILVSHVGFGENKVYSGVLPSRIGSNLRRFGSWVNGDASTGRAESAWFPAVSRFSLQLSGYPNSHGCQLFIETQTKLGVIQRLAVSGDDPMETWHVREISLPSGQNIVRFRIVAIDNSPTTSGWVGFSQPFRFVRNTRELAKQLAQVLLCALTAAAALVATLFPGMWLRQKCSQLAFLWIPVPGFLLLACLGLLCWIGPQAVGPRTISVLALGPLFCYALYHSFRFPLTLFTIKSERSVLFAVLLLTSLSVSEATYSLGPIGELYGGRISRTLQVGDRSDSRIPYHVLQLVAVRADPHGALSNSLFGLGSFSNRPPLVSLAATAVALALPIQSPQALPDQDWTIFDPQGFAAFRIVMIVIACCSLTAAFGVARVFVNEDWALLAFLVTITSPFVVHETYFTWPKLESAWFLVLASYLIMRGRSLWASLLWGIAYLCHPLALLFAPALVALVYLTQRKRTWFQSLLQSLQLAPGLALCIALWVFVNRHDFHQTSFLSYPRMAEGSYPASLAEWSHSRWISLLNTLLPLHLFLGYAEHSSVNSIFGPSPSVVRFYFQYWNTLPFGVGITYFFFLLRFLYASLWTARTWLLGLFVAPFLVFAIYWGYGSSGLLREGLHPWVLTLLIFSVILWQKCEPPQAMLSLVCSFALLLRGSETLLMMILPSIWTSGKLLSSQFVLGDLMALLSILGTGAVLYTLTFRQALHASGFVHLKQNENFADPVHR